MFLMFYIFGLLARFSTIGFLRALSSVLASAHALAEVILIDDIDSYKVIVIYRKMHPLDKWFHCTASLIELLNCCHTTCSERLKVKQDSIEFTGFKQVYMNIYSLVQVNFWEGFSYRNG